MFHDENLFKIWISSLEYNLINRSASLVQTLCKEDRVEFVISFIVGILFLFRKKYGFLIFPQNLANLISGIRFTMLKTKDFSGIFDSSHPNWIVTVIMNGNICKFPFFFSLWKNLNTYQTTMLIMFLVLSSFHFHFAWNLVWSFLDLKIQN